MDTQTIGDQLRTVLAPRVDAGIDWLNDNHPGWLDRIDLGRLDMANRWNCVGAQLSARGEYFEFVETFNPPDLHGFTVHTPTVADELAALPGGKAPYTGSLCDFGFEVLTDLWKAKITELRAAA